MHQKMQQTQLYEFQVLMLEIAGVIEEVIKSYQLELDGNIYPLKPIANLGKCKVHCGNRIPNVNINNGFGDLKWKLAIIMGSKLSPKVKGGSLRELEEIIQKNFSTMAFCQRFLEKVGQRNYKRSLEKLQMKVIK